MAQYSIYRPLAGAAWAPWEQLRREMNTLLDRRAAPSTSQGVFPPVNLYETGDAYILTAELPGVDTGDIQVSLENSTVSIHGERKVDLDAHKDANLHRRERQAGSFRRAFVLPDQVDADKVEAVHKNGVLMLRIPKSPEAKPRQIAVQAS